MTISQKLVVERKLSKRLGDDVLKQQIQGFIGTALKGNRGNGWSHRMGKIEEIASSDGIVFRATINFHTTSNRESLGRKWPLIVQRFAETACTGNFRGSPWVVIEPTGYDNIAETAQEQQAQADIRKELTNEPKNLGEVNLDVGDCFNRIYGREPHIRRILDALRLGQKTNWLKRTNTLLDGPPGSGKTELMKALAKMLGEENKAWRWFDATSMTKAGAIEEILTSPVVPPILLIEEIEKAEEFALRWLLGIMDTRGEVRRTNFRVGNQVRNVRMVVIASANNVPMLQKVMSGALYSRFQNKIYCSAPDRTIMKQILMREVQEINGNVNWVEPALTFAYDKWRITDPRDVINILRSGDRLLTGEAQRDYEITMHPAERRRLLKRKRKIESRLEEAKRKKVETPENGHQQ